MRLFALAALFLAAPVLAQDGPFDSVRALTERLDAIGAISDATEREAQLDVVWTALLDAEQIPFRMRDSTAVLYRGGASTVAVNGDHNRWGNGASGALQRAGASTAWYKVYQFPDEARIDYKLVVNGTWILDPNNPHQQWSGFGPNSELRMPSWVYPEETIRDPAVPTGSFTSNQVLQSTNLGYPVAYRVYTPSGYDGMSEVPVLYITDGHEYSDDRLGSTRIVLDNLIDDGRAAPMIAVFIDPRQVGNPGTNLRQEQYVQNPDFARFVAEELVPAIDTAYRTDPTPDGRAILGTSLGGLFSAYLGLQHPDVFQKLGIHSPAFWVSESPDWWTGPSIYTLMDQAPDGAYRVYMSTGTINDTEDGARRMRDVFTAGSHDLTYKEVPEGHSWGNWRALIDDVLITLLPGPNASSTAPDGSLDSGLRLDGWPNPSGGDAGLRFTLDRTTSVTLVCYDLLGRECARPVAGEVLAAGVHERTLKADQLAAGRYLCRLQTPDGSATRLLTLSR